MRKEREVFLLNDFDIFTSQASKGYTVKLISHKAEDTFYYRGFSKSQIEAIEGVLEEMEKRS